ncbi:MAG: PEP-CTERM system histidine kinase PrsK, partial [Proteobacteria bacterium]|nr:PEP-CTERM system histidine kinase PrsK [Pseudomonadota bacterium]
GGDWGTAAQAIFFFGAVTLLALILLSDRIRRRTRVFLSKHFYRNRYDYREEWLRLSETLYSAEDTRPLAERCIQAASQILHSTSGTLLLRQAGADLLLSPVATWNRALPEGISAHADDDFATYLKEKKWVVDTAQYKEDPEFYEGLQLPSWLADDDSQNIVVPLLLDEELIGILVLEQDKPHIKLTYEDTDLLKIVGRQVAGNLMQQQVSERLTEGKQFQAYSRLTAFLMHDLKNLVAQQSLVVKNAVRHKNNPEFIDDTIDTIANSVSKMKRLITRLTEREREESRRDIKLGELLASVVVEVSDRNPRPTLHAGEKELILSVDRDRLAAVFSHLLRNAQDACSEDGEITVTMGQSGMTAEIAVQDTGCGMDETFIRERLFRPFESTKGSGGMGIGAYQVREYVHDLQGQLRVESKVGSGTCVTVILPLQSA